MNCDGIWITWVIHVALNSSCAVQTAVICLKRSIRDSSRKVMLVHLLYGYNLLCVFSKLFSPKSNGLNSTKKVPLKTIKRFKGKDNTTLLLIVHRWSSKNSWLKNCYFYNFLFIFPLEESKTAAVSAFDASKSCALFTVKYLHITTVVVCQLGFARLFKEIHLRSSISALITSTRPTLLLR